MAKEGEGIVGAIGSSQDLTGKVSKTCKYVEEDWKEMNLKATNMIQLCLAEDVMYNVMDEEWLWVCCQD